MSSSHTLFRSIGNVIVVFLTVLIGDLLAEPVLQHDQLLIKFVTGSHIARSITNEGYMLVGIESVDSLSTQEEAINYIKLAKDLPETEPFAMYYRVDT